MIIRTRIKDNSYKMNGCVCSYTHSNGCSHVKGLLRQRKTMSLTMFFSWSLKTPLYNKEVLSKFENGSTNQKKTKYRLV